MAKVTKTILLNRAFYLKKGVVMGLFSRKRKKDSAWDDITTEPLVPMPTLEEPKECDHKWQDFPWYIEANYFSDTQVFKCKVVEPYVCVHCKERRDKVLESYTRQFSMEEASDFVTKLQDMLGNKILNRIEVEDKINDFIMVDRDYLRGYHLVHGLKDPSVSTAGEVTDDSIKLRL